MKRLYIGLLSTLFGSLLLVANLTVHPACAWFFYQPELPQTLKK
ncbi:cyclic lactone autoinducer peptide [Desulfotomaculum copahuensis]|nr:cyclic lactone autoinducer peptide [Desulfotomaculum copahuensis]